MGLFGGDRIAHRAHLGRVHDAGQARQTLRAGRAGNQSEFHFGLADEGRRYGDAVMAGLGDFEAGAEGRAVDRAHDRLGAVLDREEAGRQSDVAVPLARGDLAELFDVGPGDERLAAADEHDRLDLGVGSGRRHVRQDAFGDAGAHRVDGRIIHGDYGDVAFFGECHQLAHCRLSFSVGNTLCYREPV